MAEDREVLRRVWEDCLPVCFSLSNDDVHAVTTPDPYYLMVPRISYFPLVTDKIRKHFARHVSSAVHESEMWLESLGSPLKWHIPIGVLYDLHGFDSPLPWRVTVHFSKFPEKELLHCNSKEAVESHFMSCLKEADALKHRGTVVSGMQKKDHMQLWSGLVDYKFDQFWAINHKLMHPKSEDGFKSIPFRIHQLDQPYRQCVFRPVGGEGERLILGDLVEEVVPGFDSEKMSIITHGISPPMDTPIQWLSEHLSYPDNFLHLCVHS